MEWKDLHPEVQAKLAQVDSDPEVAKAELDAMHAEILERVKAKTDALLDELSQARAAGDDQRMKDIVRKLANKPTKG
jgi:hypothetical protein